MSNADIILPEDDRSLQSTSPVQAWASRHGSLHRDEESARAFGATHKRCSKCDAIVPRGYRLCDGCRHVETVARWEAMPLEPWDGASPLVLFGDDRYFFDEDAVLDYCDEHGIMVENLLLQHTHRATSPLVDLDDLAERAECEDFTGRSFPREIIDAANALNRLLAAYEMPVWHPRKARAVLGGAK